MKKNFLIMLIIVFNCTFLTSISRGSISFENGSILMDYSTFYSLQDNLMLHIGDNISIENIQSYSFLSQNCYFVDLINENNKEYSVIMSENVDNFKIYMIFNRNSSYYINDNDVFANNYLNDNFLSLASSSSDTYVYSTLGVTYDSNVLSTSKYFSISDISSKRSIYSSTYLSQVKLNNVPNYMNTKYNGLGCTPTTAAMYFAYLEDNGYSTACGERDLPIYHTDNTSAVNSFISYLGNNYFNTNSTTGTVLSSVPGGYDDYLDDVSLGSYYTKVSKNYNEFYNSIYNCGLPVPMSIQVTNNDDSYGHAVLGIGTKTIFDGNSNTYYIVSNYASKTEMEEVTFSVDIVRQFYFIHK